MYYNHYLYFYDCTYLFILGKCKSNKCQNHSKNLRHICQVKIPQVCLPRELREKGVFSFLRLFNHQIWVRNVNENQVSARRNSLHLTPLFHFQHSTYNQELSESPVKIVDYPRSRASPKNINMFTGHIQNSLNSWEHIIQKAQSKGKLVT